MSVSKGIKRLANSPRISRIALGLWLSAVTFASLWRFKSNDSEPLIENIDKVAHFIFYFVAAMLTANLLRTLDVRQRLAATISLLLSAAYGGLIELLQPHFGRTCSIADFIANLIGTLAGITIFLILSRKR